MTVSQQAVALGAGVAAQLEFSLRLRFRLECDESLRRALARCLVAAGDAAFEATAVDGTDSSSTNQRRTAAASAAGPMFGR